MRPLPHGANGLALVPQAEPHRAWLVDHLGRSVHDALFRNLGIILADVASEFVYQCEELLTGA